MVRIQRGWLVAVLGLSTLWVSAAAYAQTKPAKLIVGDDLALLPVDSEFVGGVDVAQLQASVLWKLYVAPLIADRDVQRQLNEFKTACDVDPLQMVTRISFGIKGIGSPTTDGVIVVHGLPKAKLVACFESVTKGKKKLGDKFTIDGETLIAKGNDGKNVALSFVDDSTALIVVGTLATRAGIKTIAAGTSALKTSRMFVELYQQTKTTDTVWMMMNGNAKAFEALANMGFKPKAVFGSISVAHDVDLDIRIRFATPENAAKLAATMQPQVQQAAAMFDKLVVTGDGPDVRVEIRVKDAKLKTLMNSFAPSPAKP
jgi:hypothetical protein